MLFDILGRKEIIAEKFEKEKGRGSRYGVNSSPALLLGMAGKPTSRFRICGSAPQRALLLAGIQTDHRRRRYSHHRVSTAQTS